MRRLFSKAVLSLGMMALAGGGLAVSATAASASPTNCNVPIVYNSANQTSNVSTSSQSSSGCGGTLTNGTIPNPDPTPPAASVAPVVPTSSTSLAFTGADIWQAVVLAGILIGAGLVVVRLSRHRHRLS